MHEYDLTKKGMFITLTYRNEELKYGSIDAIKRPEINHSTLKGDRICDILHLGGSVSDLHFATLDKGDLQKFFKKLRKHISPQNFKYFACGEYGDETNRPHYHIIITGWQNPLSDIYYNPVIKNNSSYMLDELWPFGHNTVGGLERASVQYTVGYIRKKLYGDNGKIDHSIYTSTNRTPPFQLASQGIGLKYAEKNMEKLMKGEITINGKTQPTPRYYKKKLGHNPQMQQIKKDNIVKKIYQDVNESIINNLTYDQKITRDRQINEVENAARAKIKKQRKL